jgi:Arc/MetJ-type ribon-helix-helix transcriptional regulator
MKLSVSLPEDDVEFLDEYAGQQGLPSRSAALHKAVRVLRGVELGAQYEEAFAEWENSGDAQSWESTIHDGLASDAEG